MTFEAASQSIILLKNDGGLLPLDPARVHSVAVIGPAATDMQFGAAGSPGVQPFYSINPLDGIKTRAGTQPLPSAMRVARKLAPPFPLPPSLTLRGEYFANKNLDGAPALVRADQQIQFDWNTDFARARASPRDELQRPLDRQTDCPSHGPLRRFLSPPTMAAASFWTAKN